LSNSGKVRVPIVSTVEDDMQKISFTQNSVEIKYLCVSDPKLRGLINLVGDYTLRLRTNYFSSLTRSIIGQQLSIKAARTIWKRTICVCGEVTPSAILSVDEDNLKGAGLSRAKITYIKDLANETEKGYLNFTELTSLSDEQVISSLTQIKGIGQWTAEMFLIFSLGRLDVFSKDDVGLQRGIKRLYGYKEEKLSKTCLKKHEEQWKPYRSVASLYLWEMVNRGYV